MEYYSASNFIFEFSFSFEYIFSSRMLAYMAGRELAYLYVYLYSSVFVFITNMLVSFEIYINAFFNHLNLDTQKFKIDSETFDYY